MHYDYLIVGSGLYGAVCAHELTKKGKKCLVVEKRDHIGGNVYTEEIEGINVHKYGAHIFHTSNKEAWDYMQKNSAWDKPTRYMVSDHSRILQTRNLSIS